MHVHSGAAAALRPMRLCAPGRCGARTAALVVRVAQLTRQLVGGAYAVWPDHYCGVGQQIGELDSCTCSMKGGACLKAGATVHGTNYGFMGDITLPACEAKCEEMGCHCFDFSTTPARPGENCRICKSAQSFMPLSPSGAAYTAYVYQPDWGWSFSGLVLGLMLGYVALGLAHGRLVKKRDGWDALPHRRFWTEARGLVEDGVQFARGSHPGRSTGVASKDGALLPAGGSGSASKRAGREKAQKSSGSSSRKSAAESRDRDRNRDAQHTHPRGSRCVTLLLFSVALSQFLTHLCTNAGVTGDKRAPLARWSRKHRWRHLVESRQRAEAALPVLRVVVEAGGSTCRIRQ